MRFPPPTAIPHLAPPTVPSALQEKVAVAKAKLHSFNIKSAT